MSFQLEKPKATKAAGHGIEVLRKYLVNKPISNILGDDAKKLVQINFANFSDEDQTLETALTWLIKKKEGGNLELLTPDGTSLLRVGAKGLYTKKKQYQPDAYLQSSFESLAPLKLDISEPVNPSQGLDVPLSGKGIEQDNAADFSDFKDFRQKLKRRIKMLNKKLRALESDIPTEEKIAHLKQRATLIQQFSYKIKPGDDKLLLTDEVLDCSQTDLKEIDIDPELDVGKNIEQAYKIFKKAEKKQKYNAQLLDEITLQLEELNSVLHKLNSNTANQDLVHWISKKYKFKDAKQTSASKKSESARLPYTVYVCEPGVKVLVGKTAQDNDKLTKSARSNDHWLHAVGVSGSHVVIPFLEMKKLDDSAKAKVLRLGAILALYYSRLKSDFAGEVYITTRGRIRKPKGMPPGLWLMNEAKSQYYSYSEEELKSILERKL